MKALLLAAGFGTRLRPLTNSIPKCLVPIKGRPLLDIWLENLTKAGIESFLINTHFLHEQVEAYIIESRYKNLVELAYEPELFGTAGTLRKNETFFNGEDGMLIHADNYCQADFGSFISTHKNRPPGCLMTMMTFQTETPKSCGIVDVNEVGIVKGFHEKVSNPPGTEANGAIYILSASLIKEISAGNATDFSTEIIGSLMGKIMSHKNDGCLVDIGSPESYHKVCAM
jgi:mannose-1-phosphate guanylyltransferase